MIGWFDALVGLGIGILLGVLGAWVFALKRRTQLAADLANARAEAGLLSRQIETRIADEKRLEDSFTALGTEALRANNEQFLDLARTTLQTALAEAKGDVEKRQLAIDGMVKPVKELLEKHAHAVTEIEKKREVAYRGLEQQISAIADSHRELNQATDKLTTALRRPEQRGKWGEMQLRNVVRLAGMSEHCDFTQQPATDDPATQDRPDMIVHLPGEGVIVVDSKVALDAYLDSLSPDADRPAALRRHAEQVERHHRRLSAKSYWDQFERTPKLVVMFMPLESALLAAVEVKPDIHAAAMRNHVLIATPTLLVALLRAVAFGWQQDNVADNARQIAAAGKELYQRLSRFVTHFEGIGVAVKQAGEAYDRAVGSLEKRLLPAARDLKDLHVTTDESIDTPGSVQVEPRQITATELKPETPSHLKR